ncbi:lysophospholipase [Herbaspirillum lusitanum]|uniref:Lysophospholipase n=1 Tax=Herbaspirillum lusitanum TaxID=213312 RepID=A0ABW9ABZ8_9BURK
MNPDSSWLTAQDGTRLYCREWTHTAAARGAVHLVHGLGEHGGRYLELAGLLHELGLAVRIVDHRGHGQSDGVRGSLRRPDDFLQDLKLSFDDFAACQQQTPFLFGHSMGGLIAARFASGGFSPVRGLMLSSPALALTLNVWQKSLLALSSVLAPRLALPSSLPPDRLSHDAAVVAAYRSDPLNHGRIAPRTLNFMLDAMARTQADAGAFRTPLLLQVAGDDAFVAAEGSRRFFDALPSGHKCLHWYPQAWHEIFNEEASIRQQVQRDLKQWLRLQLEPDINADQAGL